MPPDVDQIRQCFIGRDYLFTLHASDRAAQRAIRSHEIEEVIQRGEVIEDYPEDKYGPTCLIMGKTFDDRVLHVQISYPPPVKIITVYEPSPDDWETDWKTRKD